MSGRRILLPYNFTLSDRKALEFVSGTFGREAGVEVALFHAYTAPPEVDLRGSPVMEKMRGNIAYLSQNIREKEEELQQTRKRLIEAGFDEKRVHCIFKPKNKDLAGDIVDQVVSGGFHVVVISRNPGRISRFFTGSVFNKVVTTLKDVAICIVS